MSFAKHITGKQLLIFTMLFLMMFMVFGSFNVAAYEQNPEASAENQSLKIAIISDIHVTPQSMWGNCPCSAAAVIADRRMTAESQAIFEAVITDIIAEAPDVVLIPGDLTRNGEYHAHRYVAGRLDYLQSALPQATILVINGDHDINNPNAHDFSTCPAVPIPTVTPVQFREIYNNFGFGNLDNMYFIPSSGQAGGLSYVSRPADGFTIIAIDTTDGNISSELLAWVLEQADQAQDRGDTVIAFMHYNLIPHFSMQPELMPDSLVNNFGAIGQSFADAGIRYVFTGHLHAQSIAELTTTNGNTVFDIQTGSPVTYPSPVRYAIFTKTVTGDIVEREVNIRTTNITEIDFNCPITGQRITNLQQYGWDNSLNRAMLDGLISDLLGDDLLDLSGVIQDLLDTEFTNTRGETHTGLRAIIESALPIEDTYGNPISNDLADFIIDTLRSELPMDLDGLVTVLDQPNQNRIRMNALGGVGGVSITYANLRVHLVDSIFNQFDTLLGDEDFVNDLLESILAGLIDMTIYTDGANEYSVFDFIQYVYLSAMAGDATSEPWVDAIIAGLNDGSITNEMADYLVALLLPELNDLLNNVTINTGALITADTGFAAITSIPLRLLVLSLFGDPANLGSLLSTFGMDITELLGDAGGDLIPNEILDDLGGMVVDLAVSLLAGSNSAHSDNNTVLHWVGEYNPTPVFAITLTPDGDYYFSASQHYDDSNIFPHIVTITNTGNQPTGDLTVSLSGLNAGSFVIDNTTIPSIAVEGTASFSVIPMMGLGPGNYWATVTVSGEYVETQAFNVCFSFVYMPTGVLFVMSVSYENMEPVTSRPTLTFNGETIEPFWGYHYFYVPRFAVVGDVVVVEVPGFRPVTHYVNADDVSMQSVIIIIPESYRAWTVTFDLNEGELISGELVQTVDNNGNAVPPVVERDGYVFVGWNPEGGYNNITDNITITAIWEAEEIIPVQWTVTFDLNSGVLVEGESVQLVVYGGNATPPVVEREGFEFLGWYPAGAYNNITDDTTVTANWIRNIPERFIVTFDPNGGVLAAGDLEQLVRHGSGAIPPIVERENYIFIGWDPSGGYNNVTDNITITAIWEAEEIIPVQWTVTFDLNSGVLVEGESVQLVVYGGNAVPPIVERDGYVFVGWNPEGGYNNVTGNITITAMWEVEEIIPVQWTVTFDLNSGVLVEGESVQLVVYGGNAVPPVVEREGFEFLGWYPAGAYNNITDDTTITANWIRNIPERFIVTFDPNGGVLAAGNLEQLVRRGDDALPPTVERENYIFIRWDPAGGYNNVTGDIIITAIWEAEEIIPVQWTVTFDLNSGVLVEGESVQLVVYGGNAIPPVVEREGFEFLGWLPEGAYNNITNDITITANWIRHISPEFTVVFDLNGGVLVAGDLEQLVRHGSGAIPPIVERENYIFIGWDPSGGYNNITGDIIITAIWEAEEIIPVQWTVTFDLNSGVLVEGESVQLVVYGGNAVPPIVERDGYVFVGWNPEGGYNNVTDNITITAIWEAEEIIPVQWTVTFDLNSGVLVEGESVQLVVYGGNAIPPIVEREGFEFLGWYPEGSYNNITGDITITANWIRHISPEFEVTFDLNGGVLVAGDLEQLVRHGSGAIPPIVERENYIFIGWDPSGSYNNITGDIIITAIWEAEEIIPVQWTVTFDLNNGMLVAGEPVQLVVYGGNATPPVVEREGFEFLGWYPEGSYNNITDDITITANWIRHISPEFTVVFDLNGGVLVAGDLEQLVRHGNSAIPPIVERENYIFIGWDPAGGYNSVTGDITITAIWEIETSLLQLPIPTGIAISGNILTWNTVADAVGYRIYVNEIAQTDVVIETSFNLANLGLGTGTHVIQIRALGNGIDTLNSSLSDTINFVLQRPSTGGGGGTNRFTPETQPAQPPTAIQPTPEPPDEELSPRYGFEDVNTGHWFHDYVTTVVANRLFQDAGTTHFAPDGTMSRAMFVQVLANHKDVDLSAYSNVTPTFYDVMPNAEYFAAVEWAAGQDLILGIGNGNFAPGAPITREQVAAVLYRYINVVDIRLPQSYAVSFADQNYISYWAIGAVNAIQRAGIVNGRPDDIFDPQANASRAETAAIFARFLSAIQ